jgi:CRP/FNR family transcriptional regulator, anaerobic regulatory protein
MLNEDLWATYYPYFLTHKDKGLELLMANSVLVKLPAKQQIFHPGSTCENYLLVLEGAVKVQLLSETGREVLLYQVGSGDSCILTTSCLLSGDHYPAEGVTETDVTAFAISASAFHRCIDLSPYFREFVFKNFSARLAKLISRMEFVVFGSIDHRLSHLLLASGQDEISKTHQDLANELGSVREVVSRHLKIFESYGWVALKRGKIIVLNPQALGKLADTPVANPAH